MGAFSQASRGQDGASMFLPALLCFHSIRGGVYMQSYSELQLVEVCGGRKKSHPQTYQTDNNYPGSSSAEA